VFFGKCLLELLQQHQPVAQHDNLLALVEPVDELACKHGLTGAGWRFDDKSTVLVYDRREFVDELLLPVSEMHLVLISKEERDGQGIVRANRLEADRARPETPRMNKTSRYF
jgi:hypothetical protein